MARLFIVFVSVLSLAAFATATNVRKCSNGEPAPLSVIVDGCEEPPCDIVKGSTAVMAVHFVGTKDDVSQLTAKVKASTIGISVPYSLPDDVADVCGNLMYGAMCPIYESEDVVYNFNFYIDYFYPEISVNLELSLVDEESEVATCFMVDIKVKKGPTTA